MDFGLILSQLRIQRQLSQKELAAEMNISSGTIGMWETHKRLPSLYMLVKIAQYFDITTDYLFWVFLLIQRMMNQILFQKRSNN